MYVQHIFDISTPSEYVCLTVVMAVSSLPGCYDAGHTLLGRSVDCLNLCTTTRRRGNLSRASL